MQNIAPVTLAVRRDATTNATYHEERSMQQQSLILHLLHRVIHVLRCRTKHALPCSTKHALPCSTKHTLPCSTPHSNFTQSQNARITPDSCHTIKTKIYQFGRHFNCSEPHVGVQRFCKSRLNLV
jgi:hypothetical protein